MQRYLRQVFVFTRKSIWCWLAGVWLLASSGTGLRAQQFSNKTTANGLGGNEVHGVYVVGSTVYAALIGGLSISTNGGTTFTNRTVSNGLGDNRVYGVYAVGSTVYAATFGGVAISTDGGATFTNRTTANGLGANVVQGVYAVGSTVYAATSNGLSISIDGGATFTNRSGFNGLASTLVNGVYAVGSTVYAATYSGLAISTDGGATFTNRTTANGLGGNIATGVYAMGSIVYAATYYGLAISTDGGATFINRTTANGLGSNNVNNVYAVDNTVYAATQSGLSISSTALPVNLSFFSGRATVTGNQLTWQTVAETGNAGFTILRGNTPTSLEAIAMISSLAPSGLANAPFNYSYFDSQTPFGLSYYQLRQTDFDGSQHLSAIIAIRSEDIRPVLFPNPVLGNELLTLEPAQAYQRYELLDAGGKVVQSVEQEGILSQFHLPAGLSRGNYLLRVYTVQSSMQLYRIVH